MREASSRPRGQIGPSNSPDPNSAIREGCRNTGLPCVIIRPWPVSKCIVGAAALRTVAFFISGWSHCLQEVLADLAAFAAEAGIPVRRPVDA